MKNGEFGDMWPRGIGSITLRRNGYK